MSDLPLEAERACALLRNVMPRSGAKERVYRRIVTRPHKYSAWGLRIALVPVVVAMAGSLAYGFAGLVARIVSSPATNQIAEQPTLARSKGKPPHTIQQLTPPLDSRQPAAGDVEGPSEPSEPDSESQAVVPISAVAPAQPALPVHRDVKSTPSAATPELGLQVADYDEAYSLLLQKNAQAALDKLQAHRLKWPLSPFLHEVDLLIIRTLQSLGRKSEAQTAAQQFLKRHPDSARADELRHIAGPSTNGEKHEEADAGVD